MGFRVSATRRFASSHGIPPTGFEFQMLYGVRRDLQAQLRDAGYGVRVYVPFGREWFPYFMRRLGERPANLGLLARRRRGAGRGGDLLRWGGGALFVIGQFLVAFGGSGGLRLPQVGARVRAHNPINNIR